MVRCHLCSMTNSGLDVFDLYLCQLCCIRNRRNLEAHEIIERKEKKVKQTYKVICVRKVKNGWVFLRNVFSFFFFSFIFVGTLNCFRCFNFHLSFTILAFCPGTSYSFRCLNIICIFIYLLYFY